MNGEITAKVGNELKLGKTKENRETENSGDQDDTKGTGSGTKTRGEGKRNNARNERNLKTELK